jgi:hypothetical protein
MLTRLPWAPNSTSTLGSAGRFENLERARLARFRTFPCVSEAHDRAERLAGAIYGTIVVAGVLAASGYDDVPDALETGAYALATVVVFWLAHAWAQMMGRRIVGVGPSGRALRHSLARDWPLVQSALPPLAAMALSKLFGASDATAINIAFWVCVASLGVWGAVVARREGASSAGTVMSTAGCALLGLTLVALKEIVS